MGNLVMVLGGVRSGKSSFAEALATKLGQEDVVYLATAEAGDEEMSDRITQHRKNRSEAWRTVESRRELASALSNITPTPKVVLVDCLTIWISNILLDAGEATPFAEIERQMHDELETFLESVQQSDTTVIMVAGEVGMGVVPESLLGRQFRDLHGWANQRLVEDASHSYLMIAGKTVNLEAITKSVDDCAKECGQ